MDRVNETMSEQEVNVEIVMDNNNTKVIMTSVDRILLSDNLLRLETQLHLVALVLVLFGNSYVVKKILENSKTFLDYLVVADCLLCLAETGTYHQKYVHLL